LLRLALGAAAIVQGRYYFTGAAAPSIAAGAAGVLSIAAGLLLIGGIGTPPAAWLLAAGISAGVLGWLPLTITDSLESRLLVLATALAVALLGPGRFSLDSRLFGRREIIIPPSVPND
jgi:putative oxidoreductase